MNSTDHSGLDIILKLHCKYMYLNAYKNAITLWIQYRVRQNDRDKDLLIQLGLDKADTILQKIFLNECPAISIRSCCSQFIESLIHHTKYHHWT